MSKMIHIPKQAKAADVVKARIKAAIIGACAKMEQEGLLEAPATVLGPDELARFDYAKLEERCLAHPEFIKMTEQYLAPAFRRSITEGKTMHTNDQCAQTEASLPSDKAACIREGSPEQERFVTLQTDRYLLVRAAEKIEHLSKRVSQLAREVSIYDNMTRMAEGGRPGATRSNPLDGAHDGLAYEIRNRAGQLEKEHEILMRQISAKADESFRITATCGHNGKAPKVRVTGKKAARKK